MVYVHEAHALDGFMPRGGSGGDPLVEEPLTLDERKGVAKTCSAKLDLAPMTVVVDDMNDTVCNRYDGWPERLYLIDGDGRIRFVGKRGPRDFDPDALDAAIHTLLEQQTKR